MAKISNVNKEREMIGAFLLSREAIDISINNNFLASEAVDEFNQLVLDTILQKCRVETDHLPNINSILDNLDIDDKERDQARIKLNRYKKMVERLVVQEKQINDIVKDNIQELRDLSTKRRVIKALKNGLEKLEIPARELISSINKDLSSIEISDGEVTEVHVHTGLKQIKSDMKYQAEHGAEYGFRTYFRDLDAILEDSGYFAKESLTYIVGRPSNYKTGLALNMMVRQAKNGVRVALFSHEMSPINCYRRILANEAGVEMKRLKNPSLLTKNEWEAIDAAIDRVESWQLYIIDGSKNNIGEQDAILSYLKGKYNIDMVYWDYFQLIRTRNNTIPTEEGQFAEVSEELRMFAKRYGIAAIALSQANRGCEQRDDKRPTIKDIRSTGKAEQDAENILYVYRDEFYYMSKSEMPNHLEVGAIKVREGELRRALLHFNGAKATLGDCDPLIVMDKSKDYVGGGGMAS